MDLLINLFKNFRLNGPSETKVLRYALIVSLLAHITVLSILSVQKVKSMRKSMKEIKVIYHNDRMREQNKVKEGIQPMTMLERSKKMDGIEILTKKPSYPTGIGDKIKENPSLIGASVLQDKQSTNIKALEGKHKISIPILKSEKISNPKYLSYNENIRQKIKQRAYSYIDNPDFQAGEVYLTFVLSSDGMVTAIKIIEDRTRGNNYLRNVGLRSIKESSPFPPFPKEFSYPELTFNVVISFEVEP